MLNSRLCQRSRQGRLGFLVQVSSGDYFKFRFQYVKQTYPLRHHALVCIPSGISSQSNDPASQEDSLMNPIMQAFLGPFSLAAPPTQYILGIHPRFLWFDPSRRALVAHSSVSELDLESPRQTKP